MWHSRTDQSQSDTLAAPHPVKQTDRSINQSIIYYGRQLELAVESPLWYYSHTDQWLSGTIAAQYPVKQTLLAYYTHKATL